MEQAAHKKIAIIGPESTGKSKLAKELANHFQTQWVPEYARTYLEDLDRAYTREDLLAIARGQVKLEDELLRQTNGILFCDTNLIVIKIWSEFKYRILDPWIDQKFNVDHMITICLRILICPGNLIPFVNTLTNEKNCLNYTRHAWKN